ncbi:MAG: AraC-like DNA-binding protein [Granulosicoccus sp.]
MSSYLHTHKNIKSFRKNRSNKETKIEKKTRLTPENYLKKIKLGKARQLLKNKVYTTIAEVACSVDFSSRW